MTLGTNALAKIKEYSSIEFSGQTKKVRIHATGYTRVEYLETVDVPVELDAMDLQELADLVYDDSEGDEFTNDGQYWSKGECSATELKESDVVCEQKPNLKDAVYYAALLELPEGSSDEAYKAAADGVDSLMNSDDEKAQRVYLAECGFHTDQEILDLLNPER